MHSIRFRITAVTVAAILTTILSVLGACAYTIRKESDRKSVEIMTLMTLVASMWEKVGVRADIQVLEEDEFMRLRKSGQLSCYSATWTADYNDPDNFIYTFFGDAKNTAFRSLCYPREEIMQRVRDARAIADPDARLQEYRELERIIVQEDAAWIPLFSRLRYYVTGEGVEGFHASWNGSVKNNYRNMSVK